MEFLDQGRPAPSSSSSPMFSWGAYEPDAPVERRCCPCNYAPAFWSVNWAAALLHLANALATLVLWIVSEDRDQVFKLNETYAPWIPRNGTCPGGAFQVSEEWCVEQKSEETAELSLWWLVIAFHFLSFAFQALTMCQWNVSLCGLQCTRGSYVKEVDETGSNALRMVEYSISATLMQIAIALILGVWQRLTIVGIGFLTAVTMLLGLIAEQIKSVRKDIAWIAHFTGWICMGGVWFILGRQFAFTVEKSVQANPPEFVYAIVIVIAVLYLGFGVIQLVQLCLTRPQNNKALNRAVELAYCVMSLTSKTFLGWILFANALSGMARNN